MKKGFTLIEVLVSIGLFAVIVTIAVGGLARAFRSQRQVASLLAASSNISLILEQMAREMRTGIDFICDRADPNSSCRNRIVSEVIFTNSSGEVVTYCLESGVIQRGVDSGGFDVACGDQRFEKITGDNVTVQYLNFLLLGNGNDYRGNSDGFPPRVTIAVGVSPKEVTLADTVLSLQTTISSRLIDE
ncbi:MAG: prepilin-type N-terminal cleavage/methylation domain-containing protein [Candidatus Liptonbacteria bacterium]|nr:prepilin-type N-terminal cleavage/methylation domain-containing protein [Candidatus Liptonbacteria bacterium]